MTTIGRDAAVERPAAPDWGAIGPERIAYGAQARIFGQGDPASHVLYVDAGAVRLSVVSPTGKEAVVAVLEAGHFFGEGCLADQALRMSEATAMTPCVVLAMDKQAFMTALGARPAFADHFLRHMLKRNIRIQEDLVDQLFNSIEKRLARTLLLLSRYGEPDAAPCPLPRISQELLAEMVGTTRSRVNVFMNKFRKLGFIEYRGALKVNHSLKINDSLLSVVLQG